MFQGKQLKRHSDDPCALAAALAIAAACTPQLRKSPEQKATTIRRQAGRQKTLGDTALALHKSGAASILQYLYASDRPPSEIHHPQVQLVSLQRFEDEP